jgi:AcrR family transcriptional regulator
LKKKKTERHGTKGRFTRERILIKAGELFSGKGFYKTSIDDIAWALHIAKGTLYQYFKSKDELAESVLDWAVDLCRNELQTIGESRMDLREAVQSVIYSLGSFPLRYFDFIHIYQSLSRDTGKDSELDLYRELTEDISDILKGHREELKGTPDYPALALFLYIGSESMRLRFRDSGDFNESRMKDFANSLTNVFLHGIQKEKRG